MRGQSTIGPTCKAYPTRGALGQQPRARTTTSQPPAGHRVTGGPVTSTLSGFAPYFGGILSIVGIVLGAVALNQIKETPQDGCSLAVAGSWSASRRWSSV